MQAGRKHLLCSGAVAYEECEKNRNLGIRQAAGTECGRSRMTNLSREVWARRSRVRKFEVQSKSRPLAASSCSIFYAALLCCGRLRGPLLRRSGRTFLAAAVSHSTNFPLLRAFFRQSAQERAARSILAPTRSTAFFKRAWDDRMQLTVLALILSLILHSNTPVQALQYTYQPGRKLLQCTTQAQCVARCPAGNNPIYIAPQDAASGQCVCICQPAQNQNQNQRNTNDNAAQQDGSSSNSATGQDNTQNSAAVQSTPSRSGSSGLINPDVGGGGGSGGSLTGFGTLGSGLSGGSGLSSGSGGSGSAGGGDSSSASQAMSQSTQGTVSTTGALVGAVTASSGGTGSGNMGSVTSSSTAASTRSGGRADVGSGR